MTPTAARRWFPKAAARSRKLPTQGVGDGLYLFGAHDPSVIPEPSTIALALFAVAVLGGRAVLTRHGRVRHTG